LSPAEYRKLHRETCVRRNTTSADEFTRIAETRANDSTYCRSLWPRTMERDIYVGAAQRSLSNAWESSRPWRSTSDS
jgi:hypothetical protein